MLILLFLIIHLLFALLVFFLTIAFLTGAPFVPSADATARQMIEFATLKKGQRVYDLGSGDGKLLLLVARKGVQTIGLEINPFLVILSLVRSWLSPYRQFISVKWRNFWSTSLRDADCVFVYLLPMRMESLQRKLLQELKPGALVISNSFIFPNWQVDKQDIKTHVYRFRVPKG